MQKVTNLFLAHALAAVLLDETIRRVDNRPKLLGVKGANENGPCFEREFP